MKRKTPGRAIKAYALACFLLSLSAPLACASDITGTVVATKGTAVTIELDSAGEPAVGDLAEISFTTPDGLKVDVGIWKVTGVEGRRVKAATSDTQARANIGMDAVIKINATGGVKDETLTEKRSGMAWLGVAIRAVTPELALALDLPSTKGALVTDVQPYGPAFVAGLKTGDVVLRFAGQQIVDVRNLPQSVAASSPGERVTLTLVREGRKMTIEVELGETEIKSTGAPGFEVTLHKLGMAVRDFNDEDERMLATVLTKEEFKGLVVSHVKAGGPAHNVGVRDGDIINEFNRKPVASVIEFIEELDKLKKGQLVPLRVMRVGSEGKRVFYLAIDPE